MTLALAITRAAHQAPDRPAVVGAGFSRSWAQTADRIARLAAGLRAQGLRRGQSIAILAGNSAEHMELTFAAIWAGIVVVPLNWRLSVPELRAILRDSGARALAADGPMASVARHLAADLPSAACIALDRGADLSGCSLDDLLDHEPMSPVNPDPAEVLGLYYTGGTTGAPKGAELSHRSIHLQALDQCVAMECTAGSVYLHTMPFFHLGGSSLANAITYGQGTHVFTADASPAGVLHALQEYGVNFLSVVPTALHDLLDHAGNAGVFGQVRSLVYGAAPMSEGLLRRTMAAFPQARLKQAYGQTEIGGACLILPPEAHAPGSPHLAAAGRATLSVDVRIAGPDGVELPRGTAGEIQIAGLRVMNGYYGLPEKTAETIVDGWLRTGDVGIMSADGYVTVVDRLKDMIVTGGENVFCGEVENALSTYPGIAEVAVIGVPDQRWGEAVHAFIVPTPGGEPPDTAALLAHCRTRIAGYKCPKGVTFREALPRSGVGKIRKDLLRADWLAQEGRA
ncbi:class I adenylate-forming enzyme family protein [Pararhodobacter sp.]|uniref:class I adenylate-forming enzyme family protein n=1 Tax=Pararhodobacter sp. TaxID=2127056 RepID=UPI002FE39576